MWKKRRGRRRRGDPIGGPGRVGKATLAAAAVLALPGPGGPEHVHAQVMPSERATLSQTVDGTVLTMDWARPRVRGRDPLFGGVVHWDEVWTPGANDATVLEVDRDVRIDGHEVPAGRWSVWLVVREQEPWEMVLDPRADLWHTVHPEPTEDQIRFPVEPEEGNPVEALLWYVPTVRRDGATLVMAWGTTRVAFDVEVEPTYGYTMTAEEVAPFLGQWEMERVAGRNQGQRFEVEIVHHEDGSLRMKSRDENGSLHWVLQPKAEGIFQLGWTRDDELWAGSDTYLEMVYDGDGEPATFDVRGSDDEVQMTGRRIG